MRPIRYRIMGRQQWYLRDFPIAMDQVTAVFALTGGSPEKGVGMAMSDGQVAYFFTRRPDEVLTALRTAGATVDPIPRSAQGAYYVRPKRPSSTSGTWRRPLAAATIWSILAVVAFILSTVAVSTSNVGWVRWTVIVAWLSGCSIVAISWPRAPRLP
jgi:hypothetical protein